MQGMPLTTQTIMNKQNENRIKKERQELNVLFVQNKKKEKLKKADKIRIGQSNKLKAIFGHAEFINNDWKANMTYGTYRTKVNGKLVAIPGIVDKRWKEKKEQANLGSI